MRKRLALAAVALLAAACETPGVYLKAPPTVVFLTDFGLKDDSVALCKGVMWSIAPNLRIVDLSHEVPPYDVRTAGRLVAGAAPYYPAGTVFVAVVDPGVGGARKPVAVRSKKGRIYVGPDNGLFTQVLEAEGLAEAREIANPSYLRAGRPSHTFHGRDVFSPAAAYLADHAPFEEVGPALPALVEGPASPRPRREGGSLTGRVDFVEAPYGNVVTDIPAALADEAGLGPGGSLDVQVGEGDAERRYLVPFANTFGDVKPGEVVALISSRGFLTFAINQGDFARELGVQPGQRVRITRAPAGKTRKTP